MATGRVPTTANSPLTTKGDLFGYSTTQARVAVGSDGDTLVADSAATAGLRWQGNYAAGKNKVINGDFGIWQRGTSFSSATFPTFYADRYLGGTDGSGVTRTVSQQTFTAGTAPVSGYEGQYFLRVNQTVAGTGAVYNVVDQRIEDVRTLAGQTATYSFWAKADTTRSVTLQSFQSFGTGGSSDVTVLNTSFSLTTSWVRYSVTVSVPSISGKTIGTNNHLVIRFAMPVNSTFTIDTWGWQLEAGSVATAFQTATGTLQGELAACQRYYTRLSGREYGIYGIGTASRGTTEADFFVALPVSMRTSTTTFEYSNITINLPGINTYTITGITAGDGRTINGGSLYITTSGTLTQYRTYFLSNNNNTAGYIAFSAEL